MNADEAARRILDDPSAKPALREFDDDAETVARAWTALRAASPELKANEEKVRSALKHGVWWDELTGDDIADLLDDRAALLAHTAALVAERDALRAALQTIADAVHNYDGGNADDVTGWESDELRDAWVVARAALRQGGSDA